MISENYEIVRKIELSNFIAYSALSASYAWTNERIVKIIDEMISSGSSATDIINNPEVLNMIGMDIFNAPYTMDENGAWSFKMPVLDDTTNDGIASLKIIGTVYKYIISPIVHNRKVGFMNKTVFVLYNDNIEVEYEDENSRTDLNMSNIIINTVSVFLTQKYKQGE